MKKLRDILAEVVVNDSVEQPGWMLGNDAAMAIIEQVPWLAVLWERYSCAVCGAELNEVDSFFGDLCVLCREDDSRGGVAASNPHDPRYDPRGTLAG
jgi:hypothetical protein